jgi:hypothetical protein
MRVGIAPKFYPARSSDIIAAYQDLRIVGRVKGGVALDIADVKVLEANRQRPVRVLAASDAEIKGDGDGCPSRWTGLAR